MQYKFENNDQERWEECLLSLTSRYRENRLVAGFDLR
jgi:hypothetical protein